VSTRENTNLGKTQRMMDGWMGGWVGGMIVGIRRSTINHGLTQEGHAEELSFG
jgi:hypothetical protein